MNGLANNYRKKPLFQRNKITNEMITVSPVKMYRPVNSNKNEILTRRFSLRHTKIKRYNTEKYIDSSRDYIDNRL